MPRLDLATRMVFVLHNRERHKPTNTGKLSHRMLVNSELVYYGARDVPLDTRPFEPPSNYRVLFPREDGEEFEPTRWQPVLEQLTLVVLDGTWHQCSRMSRRAPGIQDFPFRSLPPSGPSRWGVRTPHRPELVCTLEAVIAVLTLLYGRERMAPMGGFFDRLCETNLEMRGAPRQKRAT